MTGLMWSISTASITSPLVELYHRNAILFIVAALHVALVILFIVGVFVDHRTVAGDPAWLKPLKFAVSLAIFAATLGWLGYHLPVAERTIQFVSIGVAVGALVEMTLISVQAARGVPSHFNDSTGFDAAVYLIMGLTIFIMTGLIAWLTFKSWSGAFDISSVFAWGIRLGLVLFVIGALEGGVMVALGTNAILPGETLPVFGWVISGDFRMAHFLGLHALQVVPLVGYLASIVSQQYGLPTPRLIVVLFALLYGAVLLLVFAYAISATVGA